jgi:hypothetical protein
MTEKPGGRRGYAAGVCRRAVALLVAGLPPESRARASDALMWAVEDLHVREGVPFGGAATAPLDLIRDELRQRALETSWRRVGREAGLNPHSLQMIAERQTKRPLPRTEATLRLWASRRSALPGDVDGL